MAEEADLDNKIRHYIRDVIYVGSISGLLTFGDFITKGDLRDICAGLATKMGVTDPSGFYNGTMIVDISAGVYAGAGQQYLVSLATYGMTLLPELGGLFAEGDIMETGRKVLAKTAAYAIAYGIGFIARNTPRGGE